MRTILGDVPEQSSRIYRATLIGPDKEPIEPGLVTSIKLTLVDAITGTIIRDAQEVKDQNGGSLEPGGEFSMVFSGADVAVIEGSTGPRQPRVGTFRIEFNLGMALHEIEYTVVNLAYV
jgi:hypothetical protein